MNHRDLILSARKKAKFAFLGLPEDLQDEIIDGLDGQTLTLQDASALVKARGHSLSHEGVAGYYRALRTERRLLEINHEMSRVIGEFARQPHEKALQSIINLAIATAASGLADGSVGIRDINLAELVKAMQGGVAPVSQQQQPAAQGEQAEPAEAKKRTGLSVEAADEIRKKVLGIK